MATFDYGLNLEIQGFEKFNNQAKKVDEVFANLSNTVDSVAAKFNNLNFGTFKIDLSSITKVRADTLNNKATAIANIAKAYSELGQESKNVDPSKIQELNKALGSGAQVKTIQAKTQALGAFITQVKKFKDIPDLGQKAAQVKLLLESFSSKVNVASFQGFAGLAKDIGGLVRAFQKIGNIQFDTKIIDNLNQLVNALKQLSGPVVDAAIADIPRLSAAFANLFKVIKSLAAGKQAAEIPKILQAVTDTVKILIREMAALNKPFTGGGKIIEQINQLSTAFRNLGVAIRSYGGASGATSFDNVEQNIQKTLKAFQALVGAFKNTSFSQQIASSVQPAIQALNALGSAFETLGRRKGFEKFPDTVNLINQAINNLNVAALQELSAKIRTAVPALQQLAEVAKAVSIVNSEAGRTFVRVAREKEQDNAANRILRASYIQLTAAIINFIPTIRSLLSAFSPLVNVIKFVAREFLTLPFRIVNAGFTALRAILISFPTKVFETGIRGIGVALQVLGTVITAPYNLLRSLGLFLRQLNSELRLLESGLKVLIAPFKLLYSVLASIAGVIGSVVTGFGKAASALNPFVKSTATATKNLSDSVNVQKNVSSALQGTGQAANQSAKQLETYNTTTQNTNRFVRLAVGGLNLFAGALVAKGVGLAVTRLVNMHIAFKTLDVLSRAAAQGFQIFQRAVVGLVSQAFNAAAEFQKLQLSISVLLGREQVNLNPGMFKDTLEAARAMKGEADALLQRFQLLAIASPFSATDIANGFRMAQVYGFTSEQAEKLTNVVVDTAAGLGLAGHEIAGIIVPLGQMKQASRATLQDLKQLSERGVPVFEILQKAISEANGGIEVTGAEVRELISAGLIEADFAVNAIVKSLGTDFKNAAGAATTSLSGLLSTTQDLKSATLREFFTPIFNAILFAKEEGQFGLADLLSFENIQGSITLAKQYGEAIAVNVGQAFQKAVVFVRTFIAVFQSIPEPIINAFIAAGKFIATVAAITIALTALKFAVLASVTTFFLFVNPITLAIAAIVALGVAISGSFGSIGGLISSVAEGFGKLPDFIAQVGVAFQQLVNNGSIVEGQFKNFGTVFNFFGNTIAGLVNDVVSFGKAFATAFETLFSAGKADTSGFKELPFVFRLIGQEIFGVINSFTAFGSAILNLPATIGDVSTTISEGFSSLLGSFVDWGGNIISSFADGISGTVDLIGQALQAIGSVLTFWLAPGSPPRIAPDLDMWGVAAALEFVNGFVTSFLSSLNDGFGSIAKFVLTFVAGTLANAFGSAIIVLTGVFTAISSILTRIGNQVYLTVKAIIDIFSTLADGTQTATEKVQGVLNILGFYVRDTFYNILGIVQGVVGGITLALGGIATFIAGEFVVAFLALNQISPIFQNAANGITNFSKRASENIFNFGNSIVNYIADTFDNVADYGANIVTQFADGMLETVSLVADALQAIGNMITYWLAPGSPPRLLPDIDQWGTDAATEFLEGFTEADFNTIGDFGNTVEKLLKNMEVTGVDTEKIVELFAGGLAQSIDTGDFGQGNLDRIHQLAGEAGTEVAILAEKYVALAKEQRELNAITKQYEAELANVQGTLDDITRTEGIESNTAKVEALTNALSNTLLTESERTRIQTQIQKLQAETRIKQLEAQKNAQERNVSSTEEALALQKEQLQLADQFDDSGTETGLAGATDASSSTTDKAAKAQDRLNDAILKYKLQTADTAGKIKIMREELAKVEQGSEEYYEILTEIAQLEERLAREREAAAKADQLSKTDALKDKFGTLEDDINFGAAGEGATNFATKIQETTDKVTKNIDEMKTNIQKKFTEIGTTINTTVTTIRGYLDTWILKNDLVKGSLAALGVIFAGAKIFAGITALGTALALLSNPVTAIAAGIIGLSAAFTYFAVSGDGFQATLDAIKGKFDLFKASFTLGQGSETALPIDLSSFNSAVITIGQNLGVALTTIQTNISGFFTNVGAFFRTGFEGLSTTVGAIFTNGWAALQTVIGGIFSFFDLGSTAIGSSVQTVIDTIVNDYFIPIATAIENNDTVLGKVSGALSAFYNAYANSLVQHVTDAFGLLEGVDITENINTFFTNNPIAATFEANINEAVGAFIPGLKDKFDLSTVIGEIVVSIQTAISGISTAFTGIQTAFQPLIDGFNTVKSALTGGEEGGILSNIIEQNRQAFSEFLTEISKPEFISGLKEIGTLIGLVGGAILAIGAVIVDVAIIGLLKNIADVVIEVGAGLATMREAFSLFLEGKYGEAFGKAFEGIQQILEGVFGNIADVIADAVKALLEFVGIDTSGPLGTAIQFISDLAVSFLSFRGILSIFSGLWSRVLSLVKNASKTYAYITSLFAAGAKSGNIFASALRFIGNSFQKLSRFLTNSPALLATAISAFQQFPDKVIGFFSTLKDNIAAKFNEIKTNVTNSFINLISTNELALQGVRWVIALFTGFVTSMQGSLLLVKNSILSSLGLIDLSAVAKTIADTFDFNTTEIVDGIKNSLINTIDSAIAGITEIAFNVADAIVISEEEKQKLADTIEGALPNFDLIFGEGATKKTALVISDFITFDEGEFVALQESINGILDALGKFATLSGISEAFSTSFNAIYSLLTGESTFVETLQTIVTAFTSVVTNLNTAVGNPFSAISETIVNLSTPITTVSEGFTSLKETISGLLEIDLSGFTNVFKPITDVFADLQSKIDGLKSGIGVLNLIPGVNIGDAEVTGGDVVQQKIKSAVSQENLSIEQKLSIITDDENLASESKKLLDAFLASYKENTGLGGYGATNFAEINKDLIEQGFTAADIESLATQFGKEVPTGLAAGLEDTEGTTDRATRRLASDLLSSIAEELGIQSPSTKARDEIGIPFVQGIVLGLSDYSEITNKINEITTAMFTSASQSFANNAITLNIAESLFTLDQGVVETTQLALSNVLDIHTVTFETIQNESIPNFVTNVEEQFVNMYDNLLDLAEEFSGEFISIVKDMADAVIKALDDLRGRIAALTTDFGNAGKSLGKALMDGIKEAIEDNIDAVIGAVNVLFGEDGIESEDILKRALESGVKVGKEITKGVAEGMIAPDVLNALRESAQQVVDEVLSTLESEAGIASPSTLFRDRVGRNLTSGVNVGIMDGIDELIETTRFMVDSVYTVARDDLGAMFTRGVRDGMEGQQDNLNTTVVGMLNSTVNAAKTALDIHSPSRVTRNMIGAPYVDGIIVALEKGKGRLTNMASGLLSALPLEKEFNLSIGQNAITQPVELRYANLLTSLPTLSQPVDLSQTGQLTTLLSHQRQATNGIVSDYDYMRMQTMQSIHNMNQSANTTVSSHVENHYSMTVMTTPDRTTKVRHNFDMMRLGRRI